MWTECALSIEALRSPRDFLVYVNVEVKSKKEH